MDTASYQVKRELLIKIQNSLAMNHNGVACPFRQESLLFSGFAVKENLVSFGSHVVGTVHKASDLDIVLLLDSKPTTVTANLELWRYLILQRVWESCADGGPSWVAVSNGADHKNTVTLSYHGLPVDLNVHVGTDESFSNIRQANELKAQLSHLVNGNCPCAIELCRIVVGWFQQVGLRSESGLKTCNLAKITVSWLLLEEEKGAASASDPIHIVVESFFRWARLFEWTQTKLTSLTGKSIGNLRCGFFNGSMDHRAIGIHRLIDRFFNKDDIFQHHVLTDILHTSEAPYNMEVHV